MCSWDQGWLQQRAPFVKESLDVRHVLSGEDREARKRIAVVAVKGRRKSPNATLVAIPPSLQLALGVLQGERRVCDDAVDRLLDA
jgi:hypothetical protein